MVTTLVPLHWHSALNQFAREVIESLGYLLYNAGRSTFACASIQRSVTAFFYQFLDVRMFRKPIDKGHEEELCFPNSGYLL